MCRQVGRAFRHRSSNEERLPGTALSWLLAVGGHSFRAVCGQARGGQGHGGQAHGGQGHGERGRRKTSSVLCRLAQARGPRALLHPRGAVHSTPSTAAGLAQRLHVRDTRRDERCRASKGETGSAPVHRGPASLMRRGRRCSQQQATSRPPLCVQRIGPRPTVMRCDAMASRASDDETATAAAAAARRTGGMAERASIHRQAGSCLRIRCSTSRPSSPLQTVLCVLCCAVLCRAVLCLSAVRPSASSPPSPRRPSPPASVAAASSRTAACAAWRELCLARPWRAPV